MKKSILTIFVLLATMAAVAQSDNKTQQETPAKKETATADKEFQNKKAEEAKQKQEAKRKAMKERAEQKEQEAKSYLFIGISSQSCRKMHFFLFLRSVAFF